MSPDHNEKPKPTDDDLLANAIPIDEVEEMEDLVEIEEIEEIEELPELTEAKPPPPVSKHRPGPTQRPPAAKAKASPPPAPKSNEITNPEAIDLVDAISEGDGTSQIRRFGDDHVWHQKWERPPKLSANGTGACHMRIFVAKLRLDAMENIEAQINQWLDDNPDYDVKFVSTTVGVLIGKINEPAMFMTVWV